MEVCITISRVMVSHETYNYIRVLQRNNDRFRIAPRIDVEKLTLRARREKNSNIIIHAARRNRCRFENILFTHYNNIVYRTYVLKPSIYYL